MRVLDGHGVSPGIAIAPMTLLERESHEVYRRSLDSDEIPLELERLEQAVALTKREVGTTREQVSQRLGSDLAGIFEAHDLILSDPAFLEAIRRRIQTRSVNAEWAVQRTSDDLGEKFAQIENEYLRERGQDLRDVTRYLLRSLLGEAARDLAGVEGPVLIGADELTPNEVLRLGRTGALGFALTGGGLTSHTTIMARALNLPLVTALPAMDSQVSSAAGPAILDGDKGLLILEPTPAELERYERQIARAGERERRLTSLAEQSAETLDGTLVQLRANIELPEELDDAIRFGAQGIGLYRSEFLYIEKSPELPSEEEQVEVLTRLLEGMAPNPVVVRTFDLGGRKLAREVMQTHEENPNLGLRGIRLTLARPEIFRTQVRALLRASAAGDLRVMIPLVSTLDEIRAFKATVEDVHQELVRERIEHSTDFEIGTMIEVPAAALIADRIALEVDFLSIGTNDLIQYALAVDRNNEHVANLYQPLHPAILSMIRDVVVAADRAGIEVSMCGEMAGDTTITPILLGLGLRVLSMSPRLVPELIARVRELDTTILAGTAWRCSEMGTSDEVRLYLKQSGLL